MLRTVALWGLYQGPLFWETTVSYVSVHNVIKPKKELPNLSCNSSDVSCSVDDDSHEIDVAGFTRSGPRSDERFRGQNSCRVACERLGLHADD